jgi:hypothetical protein
MSLARLSFSGYLQPPSVPPDPIGDSWRGPQGFAGPTGPPGTGGTGAGAYRDVTATTYTTLAADGFVAVNSVSPVTITLAAAPPIGTTQTINDAGGHAATAHITVQPASGTISGFANVILTQAHQAQAFTFTSLGWVLS